MGISTQVSACWDAHKYMANVVHPALFEAAGELINIPLPFRDPETGEYISGAHASTIDQNVWSLNGI